MLLPEYYGNGCNVYTRCPMKISVDIIYFIDLFDPRSQLFASLVSILYTVQNF